MEQIEQAIQETLKNVYGFNAYSFNWVVEHKAVEDTYKRALYLIKEDHSFEEYKKPFELNKVHLRELVYLYQALSGIRYVKSKKAYEDLAALGLITYNYEYRSQHKITLTVEGKAFVEKWLSSPFMESLLAFEKLVDVFKYNLKYRKYNPNASLSEQGIAQDLWDKELDTLKEASNLSYHDLNLEDTWYSCQWWVNEYEYALYLYAGATYNKLLKECLEYTDRAFMYGGY